MWSQEYIDIKNKYISIGKSFENALKVSNREYCLPDGLWEELTNANLFYNGLYYQKRYGIKYLAAALEGIGYGAIDSGLGITLMAHLGLCLNIVEKYGQTSLLEAYKQNVIKENKILSLATTEYAGGSSTGNIQTTLSKVSKGYQLSGKKWCITNAPIADYIVVTCIEKGTGNICAVMLETTMPGIKIEKLSPLGLKASPIGTIELDKVAVESSALLGEVGDGHKILYEAFLNERILVPFWISGVTERVLEIMMSYSNQRNIQNVSIANNQYIRKRLTDIAIALEMTRAIGHHSLNSLKSGKGIDLCASVGKIYSTSTSIETIINAIQVMGSYGIMPDSVGEHLMSSVASTIAGGTEEMHREEIYNNIYRAYRKQRRIKR